MKHFLSICILLLSQYFQAQGQLENILTVNTHIEAGVSGSSLICNNNRSVTNIEIVDGTSGVLLKGLSYNTIYTNQDVNLTRYMTYSVSEKIGIKHKDLDGGNHTFIYNVSDLGKTTKSEKYWKLSAALCDHWSSIQGDVYVHEPIYVQSITNTCIGNPAASSVTFTLATGGNVFWSSDDIKNIYLQVSYGGSYDNSTQRREILIPYASSFTLSYNQIAGTYANQWSGQALYFRIRTELNETDYNSARSRTSGPYYFYYTLPAPSKAVLNRSACYEDELWVTLNSTIISNIQNYKFRARLTSKAETSSNIIQLYLSSTSGNIAKLRVSSSSVAVFEATAGSYLLQIYDNSYAYGVPLSTIKCAVNYPFSIDKDFSSPNYTIDAIPYDIIGGTEYHLKKYNSTDGRCRITISNYANCKTPITVNYRNSNSSTYQQVALSTLSREAGTNNWILPNLSGNIYYYVYLSDPDGCPTTPSIKSDYLRCPLNVSISSIDNSRKVTCSSINAEPNSEERNDGIISLIYSGGIPPYDIFVNESIVIPQTYVTNPSIQGLSEGNYSVKVADKYSVIASITKLVEANPELTFTPSFTPIQCYGYNTDITINVQNNSIPTINYTLYNSDGSLNESKPSNLFFSKEADNYTMQVESNGCIASEALTVTQPNDIEITAIGSKIAKYDGNTGTINLSIAGGTGEFNYSVLKNKATISSGSTTESALITGLYDGYYKIRVKDENNCTDSVSTIRVRQPDSALTLTYTKRDVDCYGNSTGQVIPIAKGGWRHYSYGYNGTLVGSNPLINGLPATTSLSDTLFVVDSAGVTEKDTVVITQPTQLVTSITSVSNLNCYNDKSGSVKLNISGGTPQYQVSADNSDWTTGDLLSGLSAGSYQTIFVRDANNCPSTESVSITQPEVLVVVEDTVIDALCQQNNGAINTTISGGTEEYSYNWYYADFSNYMGINSGMLENIYSGQYFLFVTDKNNCKDTLMASVSDINGPKLNAYSIDSVSCYGGKDGIIHITDVSGGFPGYKYFIDGIETTPVISGLSNKTYHFRLTDTEGCKFDRYFTVLQPEALEISAQVSNPICYNSFDGSITTSVTGGNGQYSYLWSNNARTANLLNLNKGNLKLTVVDRKGCKLDKSFTIAPPAAPTANLKQNPSILCTGNSIQLDGGNFVSHKWYKNNAQLSVERFLTLSDAGSYTLKIANELGCIGIDTFNLKVSDHPLDAVLLVQDSALTDEVIKVVDVTWPVPDSIQWYFNKPVELDENNDWMQKFHTNEEGMMHVTLRAWYGGCFSDSSKSVTIYYDNGFISKKEIMNQPLILGYKTYPNPNNGNFSIDIKLSREAEIVLKLYNSNTSALVDVQNYSGLEEYSIPYNLTKLYSGVYLIVLSAESEQQVLKVVIE